MKVQVKTQQIEKLALVLQDLRDIYCPGDEITSATSNTNKFSDVPYWGDSNSTV